MRQLTLFSAILCLGLGLFACKGARVAKDQITHPGQMIFNGHVKADVGCYGCHGGSGEGSTWGPKFTKTSRLNDAAVLRIIDDGAGRMPPFKDKLNAEQKTQIVAWIRKAFGPGAGGTPIQKAPIESAPADKAPADKAPADKAPADKAPADKAPADKAPASAPAAS